LHKKRRGRIASGACADLGSTQVRLHRYVGNGGVFNVGVGVGGEPGIAVIDGGCPLMLEPTADGVQKVMSLLLGVAGQVPSACEAPSVAGGI
jgi:uncharacterized protein